MARFEVAIPPYYEDQTGLLRLKHEEELAVWLWAFPALLGWPRDLVWLVSPVVGRRRWPGDLWGVDEQGDLLVLEIKKGNRQDPLEDFRGFGFADRPEIRSGDLLRKWKRDYRAEVSLPASTDTRAVGHTGGILPRSNHRQHIARWPELARGVDKVIRSRNYTDRVRSFLEIRRQLGDPLPHCGGIIIRTTTRLWIPNVKVVASLDHLRETLGADHVHLYSARFHANGPRVAAGLDRISN